MKRKYYKLKHNREIIFSLLILIIIITINIGFSAFGSNLYIGDISLNVRIESDIRVTGIEIDNTLNSGISNYEEYDVNSVSASISLPNEESSVTYKVNITNIGNVEMGILNITGLPETLDYELTDYTLKDKLCNSDDNTKCTLGSITYFYITIKYKDDSYDSDNLNYNFTLNFDFKKFYTITYDNITNNGYPEEILEGDNLEITFITDVPNSLSVTMNNITLTQNTDYTYNDNTLIINDIDGDIVINSYYSADSSNISSIIDSLDENGGYIVLTDSISLEGSLTFDSGGDVTLDLSNSTISNSTLSNGDKLIVISGSTNLTITGDSDNSISSNEIGIYMDSTFTGTVTLDNINITTSGDAAVRNAGTGTLIIKNCTITSTEWAGVNNLSTGTLEVYNSVIMGNNYAIKTDGGGTSILYSGTFTGGSSAIYNSSGTTTIYGGSYNDTSFSNYLASGYTYTTDDSTGYYTVT